MTYGRDTEAADERTPLRAEDVEGTTTLTATKSKQSPFRIVHFFGGGIYGPGASISGPIDILLNAHDKEEQDRLTERWRDNRLSELSFVGVVVCNVSFFVPRSMFPLRLKGLYCVTVPRDSQIT